MLVHSFKDIYIFVCCAVQQTFRPKVMRESDQQHLIRLLIPYLFVYMRSNEEYKYRGHGSTIAGRLLLYANSMDARRNFCVLSPLCSFVLWAFRIGCCCFASIYILREILWWLPTHRCTHNTALNIYIIYLKFEWYSIRSLVYISCASNCFLWYVICSYNRNNSKNNSKLFSLKATKWKYVVYVLSAPYYCCCLYSIRLQYNVLYMHMLETMQQRSGAVEVV